jgi:hypothetical protein
MPLPVAEVGKILLGTGRAEVTGLTFINGVVWIILGQWNGSWQSALLCVRARFTVQMRWYQAGTDEMIQVDVAIRLRSI